ncbi:MAG: hypothetical protein NC337_13720 [Roseburia sp.]|nr:hypothetical protein [Roseburia sp.]
MDNNNMYNQGGSENRENPINPNNQGVQGNEQPVYRQPAYQQPVYQQSYQQQSYQPYQQPYQQPYSQDDSGLEEPVSFGDWMLTKLILCIPCVGIVMMFVWAFGSSTKKSKSNYFKASLVWALISVVVSILVFTAIVIGAGGLEALISDYYWYYY